MRTKSRFNESVSAKLLAYGLSTAAVIAGGVGLGAVALPGEAHAQTASAAANASAEASNGNEIVVTARRRSERLQDVPVAITAVTGQQMANLNVTALGDLSSFVPLLVVGRQVTGSSASMFLRGVGSTSLSAGFDQSVSFNLDGIPMSRGREILFSQYDVHGVEVLKGPQAVYFGRNTTGGLISVDSNGPGDEFEAKGKIGYGFDANETYGEGVISGPINEHLGMRLAVHANNSEGSFVNTAQAAVDPGATNFLRSPFERTRGGNDSLSGRLTVDYHPNDAFSLVFKGGLTQYNDTGAGDLYETICGSGRTTPRASSGVADPTQECSINGRSPHSAMPVGAITPDWRWVKDGVPYTDLSSGYGVLNATYNFGNFSLNSITSYYTFTQQDLNDFLGSTRVNGVTQFADFSQKAEELRLTSNFHGPLNFMVGAFYADTSFAFDTDVYTVNVAFDPVNQTYMTFRRDDGVQGTTTSVFATGTWAITPTIELSGGARWSRDEKDSFQHSLPAATVNAASFPQNRFIYDTFSDENLSPEATLSWRPDHDLSFYVAYKEGYKAGGFNISQTITAAASDLAGRFKSETAAGWEAGVRSMLLDGRLRLNATVYDYTFTDLQVQFYDPVTQGQRVANAGELETKGIEVEGNWLTGIDGLSLHANVAYNDATFANFHGQCYAGQSQALGCNLDPTLKTYPVNPQPGDVVYNNQDFSGRTAPKAPEWGAQLGMAWEMPLRGPLSARVTLDANYSSEYNYTDTLRPDGVQPEFTKWDASIALMNNERGWNIALIGRNLTNELTIATANDRTGTGAGTTGISSAAIANGNAVPITPDMNGIVERPREIYLEVGLKF